MRICAGKCDGIFCDECFPLASLSHVHGPTNFRSLNDEACPDIGFLPAGWRAMRNAEGRIYYLQDQINDFTFEKPKLPPLPAGWVAVLDTHGETIFVNQKTNTMTHVSPIFGIAPEGWDLRQTKTGRLFYVNRQTGATTWHKPLPADSNPLPPGWEAAEYPGGRVLYTNHFTKTNTWTKPTLPAYGPLSSISAGSQPVPNRSLTVPVSVMTPPTQPAMVPMVQANGPPVSLQRPEVVRRPVAIALQGSVGQVPVNQMTNYAQPVMRPAPVQQRFSSPPAVSTGANTGVNPLVVPLALAATKALLKGSGTGGGSGAVDYSWVGTGDTGDTGDTGGVDTSTLDFGNSEWC